MFVLATTDPQKVLPTIRSRTQHFEFTLLSAEELIGHLVDILGREGVEADAEALDLVARRAAGSARDALSLLDQALAVGGGTLDAAAVQAALGGAPFDLRLAVLEAVAGRRRRRRARRRARTARRRATTSAASPTICCAPCATRSWRPTRTGAFPTTGPRRRRPSSPRSRRPWATRASCAAIEILGQAIVDIRQQTVADPRLVLEVAVVRIARREARTSVETLFERVERLERQLAGGGAPAPSTPSMPITPAAPRRRPSGRGDAAPDARGAVLSARRTPRRRPTPPTAAPEPPPVEAAARVGRSVARTCASAPTASFDPDDVIAAWPAVLEGLKAPLKAVVQHAQPIGVEQGVVVFGVPRQRFDAINGRFRSEADTIKDAFAAQLGFQPRFMLRPHDFDAPGALLPVGRGRRPAPSPSRTSTCTRKSRRST